jgi:hypothetical protein
MPYRPPYRPILDRPAKLPIRALDRKQKPVTFRPGDTVRVFPEMGPGGRHPLDVDGAGFYIDTVRATYRTTLYASPQGALSLLPPPDAPVRPRVTQCVVLGTSWARCDQLELEAVTP